jgi:hypothetical protein
MRTPPSDGVVAAGILPAVEPGFPARRKNLAPAMDAGNVAGRVLNPPSHPGGKMPPRSFGVRVQSLKLTTI